MSLTALLWPKTSGANAQILQTNKQTCATLITCAPRNCLPPQEDNSFKECEICDSLRDEDYVDEGYGILKWAKTIKKRHARSVFSTSCFWNPNPNSCSPPFSFPRAVQVMRGPPWAQRTRRHASLVKTGFYQGYIVFTAIAAATEPRCSPALTARRVCAGLCVRENTDTQTTEGRTKTHT